jgi:predicted aminopeptidase
MAENDNLEYWRQLAETKEGREELRRIAEERRRKDEELILRLEKELASHMPLKEYEMFVARNALRAYPDRLRRVYHALRQRDVMVDLKK